MNKIPLTTHSKKLLADIYTPVSIYLRLRDRFRDTVLLESADNHLPENSFSFIGIHAIAGIEIKNYKQVEIKYPNQKPQTIIIESASHITELLWQFMQQFEVAEPQNKEALAAQGLFGYCSYDAIQFFETIQLKSKLQTAPEIPLIRYRLYQYVIAIHHYKDEMHICENCIPGLESQLSYIEALIKSKDVPFYPFYKKGTETSNLSDEDYKNMVRNGIQSCLRGNVFQIVLSRRFYQAFMGDELNVYRALRSINPSPYLFYFDYGDYKLMGSSPEAQLVIQNNKAVMHPIAGTVKRTGNEEKDEALIQQLINDPKENAEHVMLVDLARNDLSRLCHSVNVAHYKQVYAYSHVIHLVSEVQGMLPENYNPFQLLAKTFPAGTLSGAPKYKAMELIDGLEPASRSYYGGCLGVIGFNGSCNHAIMIRTFLSHHNTLHYQAGAGIVAASLPENELQEVNNKLAALKKAIDKAAENEQ